MVLEFALGEHFRERVCHIVICWHSFHFHIITRYYLPDEMITPEYMLGSLMRPRFLCLCNAPLLSQYTVIESIMEGTTSSSAMNLRIQTASFAASEAVIYSAFVVESVIVDCLELFQLTAPPFSRNMYPD